MPLFLHVFFLHISPKYALQLSETINVSPPLSVQKPHTKVSGFWCLSYNAILKS